MIPKRTGSMDFLMVVKSNVVHSIAFLATLERRFFT